jgi:hypothetical protein
MSRRLTQNLLVTLITLATTACGAGAASPTAGTIVGASLSSAQSASGAGAAVPTLTLGAFGNADGPGVSVAAAEAHAGAKPQLVNGILLKQADGTVWICEGLTASTPPDCEEPRLRVENRAVDDQTFAGGEGLQAAGGVRWLEQAQLFGVVRL